MFGLTIFATALLGLVSTVACDPLVDPQQAISAEVRANTWVWTGLHEVSGSALTDDEIYSLAIKALDDAKAEFAQSKKNQVPGRGNLRAPKIMTATFTNEGRLYLSSSLSAINGNIPFTALAQKSEMPSAQMVIDLLQQCSTKPPPNDVAQLHQNGASCGEISTLFMYATDHNDPTSLSGSTEVTIGYDDGKYLIKPPCADTKEGKTYGCEDVSTAVQVRDIKSATRVSEEAFGDLEGRLLKLGNPLLQPIINAIPGSGICTIPDSKVRRDGASCNITAKPPTKRNYRSHRRFAQLDMGYAAAN